jgi:CheY-like chemotaxis protein
MELKKTILVIEDDKAQQDIYQQALKKAGYSPVVRGDALAGLNWLEQILPDLILLDIMLPGLSGIDVLKEVRKSPNGKDVPIIIASASSVYSYEDLKPYGVTAFLRKPIIPSKLVEQINSILAESGR